MVNTRSRAAVSNLLGDLQGRSVQLSMCKPKAVAVYAELGIDIVARAQEARALWTTGRVRRRNRNVIARRVVIERHKARVLAVEVEGWRRRMRTALQLVSVYQGRKATLTIRQADETLGGRVRTFTAAIALLRRALPALVAVPAGDGWSAEVLIPLSRDLLDRAERTEATVRAALRARAAAAEDYRALRLELATMLAKIELEWWLAHQHNPKDVSPPFPLPPHERIRPWRRVTRRKAGADAGAATPPADGAGPADLSSGGPGAADDADRAADAVGLADLSSGGPGAADDAVPSADDSGAAARSPDTAAPVSDPDDAG